MYAEARSQTKKIIAPLEIGPDLAHPWSWYLDQGLRAKARVRTNDSFDLQSSFSASKGRKIPAIRTSRDLEFSFLLVEMWRRKQKKETEEDPRRKNLKWSPNLLTWKRNLFLSWKERKQKLIKLDKVRKRESILFQIKNVFEKIFHFSRDFVLAKNLPQ